MAPPSRLPRIALGATAGLLSAAAGVGISALIATALNGAPTPITAVGSRVIDLTPGSLKDWAIRHLGTNDKPFLLAGIYTVLVLLACVTGVLAWSHRWVALGLATALGVVGLLATYQHAQDRPRWERQGHRLRRSAHGRRCSRDLRRSQDRQRHRLPDRLGAEPASQLIERPGAPLF